jgi:hypothetical protein
MIYEEQIGLSALFLRDFGVIYKIPKFLQKRA